MGLIILGFVIFIAGLIIARQGANFSRFAGPVRILGIIVMLIGLLTACIIQIEAGQVGESTAGCASQRPAFYKSADRCGTYGYKNTELYHERRA